MIATPDVMCVSRLQLRLVIAWAELTWRRLVTSVIMMLAIISHRVHGVIMMMVMRQVSCGTRKAGLTSICTSITWVLWR